MKRVFAFFFLMCMVVTAPVLAAEPDDSKSASSGLPLPRFASLRSEMVNMRAGPGTRYPIKWVFSYQGLPVEIIAEYQIWRRIRDPEGAEGWVHKAQLSGKRMAIIINGAHDLSKDDSLQSPAVAHLAAGMTGKITACAKDWCKVTFDEFKGYLPKTAFWGAYPNEIFD